jgi:hypothetical protein
VAERHPLQEQQQQGLQMKELSLQSHSRVADLDLDYRKIEIN